MKNGFRSSFFIHHSSFTELPSLWEGLGEGNANTMRKRLRYSIFYRLLSSHLLVGILALGVVAWVLSGLFREAILERAFAQLESTRAFKQAEVERYLQEQADRLRPLATNAQLESLLLAGKLNGPQAPALKKLLDTESQKLDYLPVMVVDLSASAENGNIVAHSGDCAYMLGRNANNAISLRKQLKGQNDIYDYGFSCFYPDEPGVGVGYGQGIVFFIPISSGPYKVATIINPSDLDHILQQREGLGETGETYLVGPDERLRSSSRFYPGQSTILGLRAHTEAVQEGFHDSLAPKITLDYRGVRVLSVPGRIQAQGFDWLILAEMDEAEVLAPIEQMQTRIWMVAGGIALLVVGLSLLGSRLITQPVRRIGAKIGALSRGVIEPAEPVRRNDELGDIEQGVNQLLENLRQTADFARRIGEGDFRAAHQPLSGEDQLGIALLEMRDKLARYTQLLAEKNAELRRLGEERLRAQIAQEAVRTRALIEGQESERSRIARELHDGVGQLLTAIQLHVDEIVEQPEILPEVRTLIEEMREEIRGISNNLMPNVLLDFGLHAGLSLLAKSATRHGGIPVRLEYTLPVDFRLRSEVEISLYRIAQEAVNNALRHAHAHEIRIFFTQTPRNYLLRITDDGQGMPTRPAPGASGLGIPNLKARARLLGGRLDFASAPGCGTRITLRVPIG